MCHCSRYENLLPTSATLLGFAQVLDAALLRPGRFDRRVSVERPDRRGREQILKARLPNIRRKLALILGFKP